MFKKKLAIAILALSITAVYADVSFPTISGGNSWWVVWPFWSEGRTECATVTIVGNAYIVPGTNEAWFAPGAILHFVTNVTGDNAGNGWVDDFSPSSVLVDGDSQTNGGYHDYSYPLTSSTSARVILHYWGGVWGNDEQDAGNASYTLNLDNTPPTPPIVTATPSGWTTANMIIKASESVDSESGLQKYQYQVNGGPWIDGDQVLATDYEIVTFRAVDNVGNCSTTVSYIASIDRTPPSPPSITFADQQAQSGNWTKDASQTISFSSVDQGTDPSGIDHYTVSVDSGSAVAASSPYTLPALSDGQHVISVTAYDMAGNSTPFSRTIQIDTSPPVIGTLQTNFDSGFKNLSVSWIATDTGSGIASCSLNYTTDSNSTVVPVTVTPNGSTYSATIPLSGLYGSVLKIDVAATDSAQNTTTTEITVPIVPQIGIKNINLGADVNGYMEVDLDFGVSAAALQSFTALTVTRTQANPGTSTVQLPPLSIDPSTMPTALSAGGASPGGTPWKLGANGDAIFADYIPVSSGAGHKAWTYTLTSAVYGVTGHSWDGISPAAGTVSLPNNQGTVSFSGANIFDMKGNPSTSSSFAVGATGEVEIEIQGSDPDQDAWGVEVDKVTQVTEPSSGEGSYTFTSYASLGGKSPVSYGYPYGNVLVPVNLSVGDNNIELVWTEGADTTVEHSQVLDLVLKQNNGVYTLTVTDGYGNQVGGTGGGLTVAPWQPLQFSVSAQGGSDTSGITWIWGDGSPNSSGASATHAYQEAANQTAYYCTYPLTIELPGGTSIPLTVRVQDTQEGALWGNETWHGDHTVLGVVVVPQGMTLTIASGTVSFQGDLGAGFGQGITVNGDLQIAGGVTLEPAAGQSQGWGTVLVEGTAEIGTSGGSAVTIEGADRGIAADAGSAVTLVNTELMNNLTGIQVVRTQNVTITGCTITGNSVYGVKEDAGGRPTLTGTTIKGSFRDYYQWDGGLLTIMQINALGKNSGNQGE